MYVKRNFKERSRKHYSRGKVISIKYYKCVCLYSCLTYPTYKSHLPCVVLFVICGLLGCTTWPVRLYHVFPHYLIKVKIFEKKLFDRKFIF